MKLLEKILAKVKPKTVECTVVGCEFDLTPHKKQILIRYLDSLENRSRI